MQLERADTRAKTPLTPQLKQFIDRAIVPTLVRKYLAELVEKDKPREGSDETVFHMRGENELAKAGDTMKNAQSATRHLRE